MVVPRPTRLPGKRGHLVLAPTRAKLRGAVRAVNEVLSALRLEKHPDKTFIGKIERGFDFLGYRFGAAVLQLAQATIAKFVEQATRLYEQGRRERRKGSGAWAICSALARLGEWGDDGNRDADGGGSTQQPLAARTSFI